MNDYLGNEIKINDDVIYILYLRTGSSSSRNMIAKGKVIGFKKSKVEIKREYFDTDKRQCQNENIDTIDNMKVVVIGDSSNG